MKLLGLLALVVAIQASSINLPQQSRWLQSLVPERQIEDTEFRTNREYKFFYNGQLATGIPGSSLQHSATRIQALVSLVFRSEHECLLKIVECRFGKYNEQLTRPREIMPFEMYEQVEVQQEHRMRLHKPLKFTYRHGMINNIQFDSEERPWSANIKRGILNLLQVNLLKHGQIQHYPEHMRTEESSAKKQEFFNVMEKTIEGECETLYTVTEQPCNDEWERCRKSQVPMLNITKSINFEKCQKRPEIRYNERFQQICPTCEARFNSQERTLRSSTVSKINMVCPQENSRSKCLIEEVSLESQYHYVLFNEEANMITSYVKQSLQLVKTSPIEMQIEEPSQPIQSDSQMIYTPDWEIMKEQFYMDGQEEFFEKCPYSEAHSKIEVVKKTLRKLVHYMRDHVQEEAPRQFTRLVKLLRILKMDELRQCHQRFYKNSPEGFTREEHKKIKHLLVDALALCGTRDCIKHLVESIEHEQISPIKGSLAIKKLMEVRVVSQPMIEELLRLCEQTDKCERSPALKQAVYLTTGALMNALCVESRDKYAVEFKQRPEQLCPRSFREQYVQKLISLMKSTEKKYEKILFVKSLRNAGLDTCMKPLEKIIRNKEMQHSLQIRVEAITAIKQLCQRYPKKVQSILMPIYMNRNEYSHVRIAALAYIMRTVPEKPVLDQITRQLFRERQRQVASFTYTYLQSLANSTVPCEKRLADDLKLSLRQGRYLPVRSWIANSKVLRAHTYSPWNKMGITTEFASVMSNYSYVPQAIVANLQQVTAGGWNPRMLTVGFQQFGLEQVISRLFRGQSHYLQSSLSEVLSGNFKMPSPKFNYRKEMQQLFDDLEINERQYSSEYEPFAQLFLTLKDQEYGFVPISKEVIPESIKELLTSDLSLNKIVKRAERMLRDQSMTFNVQTGTFLHEQERKIPTTIGMPLRLSIKIPTVMQASGIVQVQVDNNEPLRKVKLVLKEMKPSIMSTMVVKMECWSPIINHGLKVLSQAKVYMPFDVAVSVDTLKNPPELKIKWEPELQRKQEIVVVQTRPVTYTLVWPQRTNDWIEPEERTIHGSEWTRVSRHFVEFGEHSLGVKFQSRAFWHHTPEKRVPTTPFCPLSGPNKYVLTMQPGYEMPQEISMRITGKLFKSFNKKTVDVNFDKFYEEEEFLQPDSSEEQETPQSDYYKRYEGKYPVNNQFRVEFKTKGSSIKRQAILSTSCLCGSQMKSCKCKLDIERTPIPTIENQQWKMSSQVEMLYPETPYTMSQLTSDKNLMCRIFAKWGPKGSMDKKCDIKIVAEQSQWMQELKDSSLYKRLYDNEQHRQSYQSLFSPVGQYSQTLRYGLLDEIKIDVDYKLPKYQQEIVNQVYRMLKHYYYSQSYVRQINIEQHPEGRIRATLNIDPINRRYCNMTIMTPQEYCQIQDIPLPTKMESMNMRRWSKPSRSGYEMVSEWFYPSQEQCEVRSDRVKTFDQVKYNVPTSTCYSVIAKDCYSRSNPKFVVLIKKQSTETEKKTLKIITPSTKLIIRATNNGEIECELNDQQKSCERLREVREHSHVVLRCRYEDQYLGCQLPEAGVKVYFDGYAANVKVSSFYQSQVCGLCGHYEQQSEQELYYQRPESRRELFDSYLVEQGQCQHEWQEQPTQLSWDFDDDRYDTLPETVSTPLLENEFEVQPIERTKVIEQPHEICFSKEPVKKCPRHTYPVDYHEQQQKVVYACLPRNQMQTEIYQQQAYRDQTIDEIESEPAKFTEKERIPKSCRQY